jgi:hypothetical protein
VLACEPLVATRIVAASTTSLDASDPSLPFGPGGPLSPLRAARTRFARTIGTDAAQHDKAGASSIAECLIIQIAQDEWLVVGTDNTDLIVVDDRHAIVESDHGWVGAYLDAAAFRDLVSHHVEWLLPEARPALAQGQIAGVPCKLYLEDDDEGALLICLAALAHELEERVS